MSEVWANRERRTNRLVRAVAGHMLNNAGVTAAQLYGLCKLTWITRSFDTVNSTYINSTKIPALGHALSRNYAGWSLADVAEDVAVILGSEESQELVLGHTGFNNIYGAYRNSCYEWIEDNRLKVTRIFRRAFALSNDAEGRAIAKSIGALPPVPKANVDSSPMRAENLLTPVVFSLDERIRFPLINGNLGVQALLAKLGVADATLEEQYVRMVAIYGQGGIQDAADLDQIGDELPDFISVGKNQPKKKLLEKQPTVGRVLPVKDERDVEALQESRTVTHRRRHNALTNALRDSLASFTLIEGADPHATYDVMIKNYNGAGDDLLVEAKSATNPAQVRMAVGQLFDYWFNEKGAASPHLAILTPEKPTASMIALLHWLDIGVLWIEGGALRTCSQRLNTLCTGRPVQK